MFVRNDKQSALKENPLRFLSRSFFILQGFCFFFYIFVTSYLVFIPLESVTLSFCENLFRSKYGHCAAILGSCFEGICKLQLISMKTGLKRQLVPL